MWNSTRRATPVEALPPRLARAYRLTCYQAAGLPIEIGRRAPAPLLTRLGCRTAVLLTAWNPRSRRMPDDWNERMQRRLRQRLRRFRVIEATGAWRGWHEAMLLVAGPPAPLIVLAARFRQRAVVVLTRGGLVRLRLL
jgi:hypothetical protein